METLQTSSPFFSVIIPAYNSYDYIKETLQSLADQSFKEFEVLLIDDGSNDGTLDYGKQLLLHYKLNGKALPRESHRIKGVASCRNYGASLAKAPWICFLDSDDLFQKEKLGKTFSYIQSNLQCKAFFHSARFFQDRSNETLSITKENITNVENILSKLTQLNFICTSTVTIQKKLFFELEGFDTGLHGVEDYYMWLRISKHTSWHYSTEVLTDYRVRASSLMGNRDLSYYVDQGNKLIILMEKSGEFSEEEIRNTEKYMMNENMKYYAGESISRKGWGNFLNGLWKLALTGRISVSSKILLRHLQFNILKIAVRIFKKNS